jgi:hypothetical protein
MPDATGVETHLATCKCEAAAQRAVLGYEVAGIAASFVPLNLPGQTKSSCCGWAVTIPSLGRLECVLDSKADLDAASPELDELSNAGWSVWALVPLDRLSRAHEAFQSGVEFVQGWWDNNEAIVFTAPEIP